MGLVLCGCAALALGLPAPASALTVASVSGTRDAGDDGSTFFQGASGARAELAFFEDGNTSLDQDAVAFPPGFPALLAAQGQVGTAAAAVDGASGRARVVTHALPDNVHASHVTLDAETQLSDSIVLSSQLLTVDLSMTFDQLAVAFAGAVEAVTNLAFDFQIYVPPDPNDESSQAINLYSASIVAFRNVEGDGSTFQGYSVVETVGDAAPVILADVDGAVVAIPQVFNLDEVIDLGPLYALFGPLAVDMTFSAHARCDIFDGACSAFARSVHTAAIKLDGSFTSANGYQYLGPESVPEPSPALLSALGLLGALAPVRPRGRRSRDPV